MSEVMAGQLETFLEGFKKGKAEAFDNVNHPKHYNSSKSECECGRRIECIDITRHMNFNIGNAVKYLWRYELKGGLEDLKKAIWYIQDEINKEEDERSLQTRSS